METLAKSLRPRRLSELVGQDSLVRSIRKHMETRPPSTWMLIGPPGTGKTTLARIMAVSYQCTHQKIWGDPCNECWARRTQLYDEKNASFISGVEELRAVVELADHRPINNPYRVFIIDEAQKISHAAQNMLLKPWEEPCSTTIWIICTTDPSKLQGALKRRPITYKLKTLGVTETETFLKNAAAKGGIKIPLAPLLEQIHLAGIGAPGVALQALEKFAAGSSATEAVDGSEAVNSYALCKAVISGSWKETRKWLDVSTPDDARFIRASVAGYIKGILAKEIDPKKQERAATSLLELCSPPFDDATMIHWLWATLWKISRRYKTI